MQATDDQTQTAFRRWAGRAGERRLLAPWAWAAPAVVLVIALIYVADLAGGYYSLTDWSGSSASAKWVGLHNFRQVFHDSSGRSVLVHSLLIAAVFVVVA